MVFRFSLENNNNKSYQIFLLLLVKFLDNLHHRKQKKNERGVVR